MDVKTLKDFYIFPPKPGLCAVCGVKHDISRPHNSASMYYKYRFHQLYDRFPTWSDAIAHMEKDKREFIKQRVIEFKKEAWVDCDNPIAEPYEKQE